MGQHKWVNGDFEKVHVYGELDDTTILSVTYVNKPQKIKAVMHFDQAWLEEGRILMKSIDGSTKFHEDSDTIMLPSAYNGPPIELHMSKRFPNNVRITVPNGSTVSNPQQVNAGKGQSIVIKPLISKEWRVRDPEGTAVQRALHPRKFIVEPNGAAPKEKDTKTCPYTYSVEMSLMFRN